MVAKPCQLLGFDIRICEPVGTTNGWPSERRSTYLLRTEVRWPLSVDTMVWPSVFHFSNRLEPQSHESIDLDPSTDIQLVLRLWDSRCAMEQKYRQCAPQGQCYVRVAIELVQTGGDDPSWTPILNAFPESDTATADWLFLGYDVADSDFVSGLMNISYTAPERAELVAWARHLNKFGLFDDVEKAAEFKIISNRRTPDHASFLVYRLLADLSDS